MRIVIGVEHLSVAKQQAHQLRDRLNNIEFGELEKLHTKSSFLNTWAMILGYDNWGDFSAKTKYAHKNSNGRNIITPDTINYLAKKLCQVSYFPESYEKHFESALFMVAEDHEKALFHPEYRGFYSKLANDEIPIIIELGPSTHVMKLIDYLFGTVGMSVKADWAEKELLDYAKTRRKSLGLTTRKDIEKHGLNIYPNSSVKASDVVSQALEGGWIDSFVSYYWVEPKSILKLSTKAMDWLFEEMTGPCFEEWLAWNREVDELFLNNSYEVRVEKRFSRLKSFAEKKSPEGYVSDLTFHPESDVARSAMVAEVHQMVMKKIEYNEPTWKPPQKIFHLAPILVLSRKHARKVEVNKFRVEALIEFFGVDDNLIGGEVYSHLFFDLCRPYPNKRYLADKSKNGVPGWFVAIPDGTARVECRYTWHDGQSGRILTHTINHPLNQVGKNVLYSPHHLDNYDFTFHEERESPYSFFDLNAISGSASSLDEIKSMRRFKDQVYKYETKGKETRILENFPLFSTPLLNYSG